jgi:hypothetical protein
MLLASRRSSANELFSQGKLIPLHIPASDGELKVEKGVVGRVWWGDAQREGHGRMEEGENGWCGRLIHFWVTRVR